MDYPTFIQVSKFDNALFHFGNLPFDPQTSHNTEFYNSEVAECISALQQFPVVTCDEKFTRKGYYTITSRWTFGERKIALYPKAAKAAMEWADEQRKQYYHIEF